MISKFHKNVIVTTKELVTKNSSLHIYVLRSIYNIVSVCIEFYSLEILFWNVDGQKDSMIIFLNFHLRLHFLHWFFGKRFVLHFFYLIECSMFRLVFRCINPIFCACFYCVPPSYGPFRVPVSRSQSVPRTGGFPRYTPMLMSNY